MGTDCSGRFSAGRAPDELAFLVAELDTIQSGTQKYRDIDVAIAHGYIQCGGVASNVGAHFEDATLDIGVGASIVGVNTDGVPHTVAAGSSGAADGDFYSDPLGPSQSFTRRFEGAAAFAFT